MLAQTSTLPQFDPEILSAKKCPYCGAGTRLMDSANIYHGRSYGNVWACVNWPSCDAFVGTHKDGSDQALGRLANAELRYWKKRAHAAFDPIWQGWPRKNGMMGRSEAYKWLSQKLLTLPEHTHIGMFDVGLCKEVVAICEKKRGVA